MEIAPRVTALIDRVLVTDDQRVGEGELLVQLDDREFQVALAKATAGRTEAEAEEAVVRSQWHLQDAIIDQAQAELTATAAEALAARVDASRYQDLQAEHWAQPNAHNRRLPIWREPAHNRPRPGLPCCPSGGSSMCSQPS